MSVRKASVRRVLIDGSWKLARKPRQQFFLRQARLLFQRSQHIRANGLFQLWSGKLLVRAIVDPRFGNITLPILFEAFEQFAQTAAKQSTDAAAAKHAA